MAPYGFFRRMDCDTPIRNNKEQSLFASLEDSAKTLSISKQKELFILTSRTSRTEWSLVLFFSLFLLSLVTFMQLGTSYLVSVLITAGMNISVLLLPIVTYHIDFMSVEEEAISKTPYADTIAVVNSEK